MNHSLWIITSYCICPLWYIFLSGGRSWWNGTVANVHWGLFIVVALSYKVTCQWTNLTIASMFCLFSIFLCCTFFLYFCWKSFFVVVSELTWTYRCAVEVGRYIKNIVDISSISIYRYRIGTLNIGFSICRYRIVDKWNIGNFFLIFYIFFGLFNVNLKTDNLWVKLSILFGNMIRHYTSLPLY